MTHLTEELVRAHVAGRLHEAQSLRVGARFVRSRRLRRRAEQAARAARLASL